jgi:hypothetical protein
LATLIVAPGCSAANSTGSSGTGGQDQWKLVIDGQTKEVGHASARYISSCGRQNDGRLNMVWTGNSVDGSTNGAVTVFINGDGTVYSVGVRLNAGAGQPPWQGFYYGPGSETGTTASVVAHQGTHYHIAGTLEGGAPPSETPVALAPPLHQFDLQTTCVTND